MQNRMLLTIPMLLGAAVLMALLPTAAADNPCVGDTCIQPDTNLPCVYEGAHTPTSTWVCAGPGYGICDRNWAGSYWSEFCLVQFHDRNDVGLVCTASVYDPSGICLAQA